METLGSVDREDPSSEDEDSEDNQELFPNTDTGDTLATNTSTSLPLCFSHPLPRNPLLIIS